MAVLWHESPTPSWLAPGVSFDVVIEAHAEQHYSQQAVVYLGAGWWWQRATNCLFKDAARRVPTGWRQYAERSRAAPLEPSEPSWLDEVLLKFALTKFS